MSKEKTTAVLDTPPVRKDPLIHLRINKTAVNKDSIEGMTPETDKKVRGRFVNVECPGQPQKICGRYYKGMQYFSQVLEDDQVATIPWSVARWINERYGSFEHTNLLDDKGVPIKGQKFRPRGKFIIEEFLN